MPTPIPGGFGDVPEGFQPMPNGVYDAIISDGDETVVGPDGKKENVGKPMYKWEFTISDEEYEGRKAWLNTTVTEKALPILKSFLKAVGYTDEELNDENFVLDVDDVIGRSCKLVLVQGVNPKTKEKNNSVRRVLPVDFEDEAAVPEATADLPS